MEKGRTEAFVVDILLNYALGFSPTQILCYTFHFFSLCSLSYLRFFNPCVFNSYKAYG